MDETEVIRRVTTRLIASLNERAAWHEHMAASAAARHAYARALAVTRGELAGDDAERAFNDLAVVAGELGEALWNASSDASPALEDHE